MPIPRFDVAKIEEIRQRFEAKRKSFHARVKNVLSFDELLELFNNTCVSFSEIAEKAGVSREDIRLLYRKYFSVLFPTRKTGRLRQKVCALKTNFLMAHDLSDTSEYLSFVAEIAKSKGFSVQKIPTSRSGYRDIYFSSVSLLINNKRCSIHLLTKHRRTNPKSKSEYFRLNLYRSVLKKFDFNVIILENENNRDTLIVPSSVFLSSWDKNNDIRRDFFIRKERFRSSPQRKHPKINFWDYHEAWHLLAQEATP